MTTLTTQTGTSTTTAAPARLYGLVAEFENPAQIVAAAEKIRDKGYRYWDCHTPFPVHGLD
ncbi:MAG: quinol:electron acceptor oxidoreductase subunit ActD, partial [Planctomycetota bacterium]